MNHNNNIEIKDVVLINGITVYDRKLIDEVIDRCSKLKHLWGVYKDSESEICEIINASHSVKELYVKDNQLLGTFEFLKTVCGKTLENLYEITDVTHHIREVLEFGVILRFDIVISNEININYIR